MKINKFLKCLFYIYIYTVAAIPNCYALSDATSFNPEQVQVQAQSIGVPVGTVIVWTKEEVPQGWLECDGQKVNEVLYPELHKLMPTTPDYRGRFLQGIDTNTKVGDKIEAGLPNLAGVVGTVTANIHSTSGVFKTYRYGNGTTLASAIGNFSDDFYFNASWYNPIYGNSETVQPPAVVVKYIIKAE